ncbi:hypothetical protein N8392_01215 [Candidatus Poseidonia sp.]|nr:hypothetical protein [Poseidonia sp.]
MLKATALPVLMVLVLLASTFPVNATSAEGPTFTVSTHWVDDGNGGVLNQYLVQFDTNGSYTFDARYDSNVLTTTLSPSAVVWGASEHGRTATITFDHVLVWGEQAFVSVNLTAIDGEDLVAPVVVSRTLTVGQWNQPMDDHEVLLSTAWSTEQTYTTDDGPQRFGLTFDGQGWQQRIGTTVHSWELGNGAFRTLESTNGTTTDLNLVLTQLWKNETIVGGVLTSQVFDARGYGDLNTTVNQDGVLTVIHADVSQAMLNRSMIEGIIEEQLLLEATGVLNVSDSSVENSSLNIDGELAVFFLEYHDVAGSRILQHTQFEAMADFVLVEDGTRLDVSLDGFSSLERWENGSRVLQHEELYGSGTFGFEDQDENASLQVNGTILDLHSRTVNGTTLIDDLHVDGVLSGDVQGTFGVVRSIEETGTQANAEGEEFDVNVIHQESWFNITGLNGGNFFDGAGVGATHNETWDYQVVHADWDNRTVRLVWRETGADASEGDERPANSPLQRNPSAPEVEQTLGNLTVGRETGLMPIPMRTGDRLVLNAQEGLSLDVMAGTNTFDVRDGRNFSVVAWVGTYGGDEGDATGNASGRIVSSGPLGGLLSSVHRQLSVPFGEAEETIVLNESQVLERVVSPQIVTAGENAAPIIESMNLREGLVVGEGGSLAHVEVQLLDPDYNVESVTVDLTPLGGGTLSLNDRGLDGDSTIGDDVFTGLLIVPGLQIGTMNLTATAIDAFDATTSMESTVTIVNQAPRLTNVILAPQTLERGTALVVNVEAYDGHGVASLSLDLRTYGGIDVPLVENGDVWTAMVDTPSGLSPGVQSLTLVATDNLGATQRYSAWAEPIGPPGDEQRGPHHLDFSEPQPIEITVLNDRPTITPPVRMEVVKTVDEAIYFTVNVTDPDGVYRVEANLGVFNAVGAPQWVPMRDDGNDGDQTAGDGVYSVPLSIRSGTPLGTHEITLRATDTFGELSLSSATVALVEGDAAQDAEGGISAQMLGGIGLLVLIGAVIAVVTMTRSSGKDANDGNGRDRFGME